MKIFESILRFVDKYKLILFIFILCIFVSLYTFWKNNVFPEIFIAIAIFFLISILSILPTANEWRKNVKTITLKRLSYKGQWFSGSTGIILTSFTFLIISVTFYYQFKETKRNQYQTFENNFYKMVDTYNQTTESLEIPSELFEQKDSTRLQFKGRNVFKFLYSEFKSEYNLVGIIKQDTLNPRNYDLRKIDSAYSRFAKKFQTILGRYFRTLYYPLYFVKRHGLRAKPELESYLTKVFRAQISDYELFIIFYYCLTSKGSVFSEQEASDSNELCCCNKCEFKNLIEEYHILKYIPDVGDTLLNKRHQSLYKINAFCDTCFIGNN